MTLTRRTTYTLLFALATLTALAACIHLSLDPGNYFFYRAEDRAEWRYSPGHVALVCGLMLAEALVAWCACVLPRPRALWLRCAIALTLLLPWTLFSSMLIVHMPLYVMLHHLWTWLVVLGLAIIFIASAAAALLRLVRGGE